MLPASVWQWQVATRPYLLSLTTPMPRGFWSGGLILLCRTPEGTNRFQGRRHEWFRCLTLLITCLLRVASVTELYNSVLAWSLGFVLVWVQHGFLILEEMADQRSRTSRYTHQFWPLYLHHPYPKLLPLSQYAHLPNSLHYYIVFLISLFTIST
jgi:hypothetical protein